MQYGGGIGHRKGGVDVDSPSSYILDEQVKLLGGGKCLVPGNTP